MLLLLLLLLMLLLISNPTHQRSFHDRQFFLDHPLSLVHLPALNVTRKRPCACFTIKTQRTTTVCC
jgi:hypothetical protein